MIRRILLLLGTGAVLLLVVFLQMPAGASGLSTAQEATPVPSGYLPDVPTPTIVAVSNETCIACHGTPGLTLKLKDGESLDLFVSPEKFAQSIHGDKGYACVQCHTSIGNYPHPPFSAENRRDASLQLYQACKRCHTSEYENTLDSVHAKAMKGGNLNAAICTDCHTAHEVRQLTDPDTHQLLPDARVWIPQTCAKCHSAIYDKYKSSVHGSALIGEGNPDVPTCIDCHGVHNIGDPTTAAFRLKSPQLCASCHTNPKLMDKYGISTNVLQTYVADFHGTTVLLFEKQSPDAETNKPVCFDCHGVHDISRPDDPQKGLEIKANLLTRCQECHPDANLNFPDAWLSHYIPSAQKNTLVFSVDLFYKLLIPTVLGGMAILVGLDVSSTVRQRVRRRKPIKPAVYPAPASAEMVRENLPPQTEPEPAPPPAPAPADLTLPAPPPVEMASPLLPAAESPEIAAPESEEPQESVLPPTEPSQESDSPATESPQESADMPEPGPEPGND